MSCFEFIGDIVSIEAYAYDQIRLPYDFMFAPSISADSVLFSGNPIKVIMEDNSASASYSSEDSSSGNIFTNNLTWGNNEPDADAYSQYGSLMEGRYHFLLTTSTGKKKLIYNWHKVGKVNQSANTGDSEDSITLTYAGKSRIPILTLF